MPRRYATVRGATGPDLTAAIETEPATSLDSSLTLLSTDTGDPVLVFTGDAGPFAVIEYTADELAVRTLLTDWVDWANLDPTAQQNTAKFVSAKDLELGEILQGLVLVDGWIELAATGTPAGVTAQMLQQLNTGYAASASNNGGLTLARELIRLIPTSVMEQSDKDMFIGMIDLHFLKWPRPVDVAPVLPPQIREETSDFDFEVYVPAYWVDATAGAVDVTLPPLADAGVLPYWWTEFVIRNATGGKPVTLVADGSDTINGLGTYVVSADAEFKLGGTASEWRAW